MGLTLRRKQRSNRESETERQTSEHISVSCRGAEEQTPRAVTDGWNAVTRTHPLDVDTVGIAPATWACAFRLGWDLSHMKPIHSWASLDTKGPVDFWAEDQDQGIKWDHTKPESVFGFTFSSHREKGRAFPRAKPRPWHGRQRYLHFLYVLGWNRPWKLNCMDSIRCFLT